nr:uncharacterized protein LOC109191851 [Ipomoea batatas]
MVTSYASSLDCERDTWARDFGEAIPTTHCRCGNQLKSRGCGFIEWFDHAMCKSSKKIIPGLLKRLNKQEEDLKFFSSGMNTSSGSVAKPACSGITIGLCIGTVSSSKLNELKAISKSMSSWVKTSWVSTGIGM